MPPCPPGTGPRGGCKCVPGYPEVGPGSYVEWCHRGGGNGSVSCDAFDTTACDVKRDQGSITPTCKTLYDCITTVGRDRTGDDILARCEKGTFKDTCPPAFCKRVKVRVSGDSGSG